MEPGAHTLARLRGGSGPGFTDLLETGQGEPEAPGSAPTRPCLTVPEIGRQLAQAHDAFQRGESPAVWGAEFEAVLGLLESEDSEPQRMEVLLTFARLLLETWRREGMRTITGRVAHLHFLEAACLADRHGQEHPATWLSILHDLYRLEWWMAEANRKAPPRSGLYFNLAVAHHDLASRLYNQWGNSEMREQALVVGSRLLLQGKRWASSAGLQGAWEKLHRKRVFKPLYGVQLLGLATNIKDETFVEEHSETVHAGLAELIEAGVKLAVFYEELLEIGQYADATAGAVVIKPWMKAVEGLET